MAVSDSNRHAPRELRDRCLDPDPLDYQELSSDSEIIRIDDDDEPVNDPLGGSPGPSSPEPKAVQMTPGKVFLRSVEDIGAKKQKLEQPFLRCRLLEREDTDTKTTDRQDQAADANLKGHINQTVKQLVQTTPVSQGVRPKLSFESTIVNVSGASVKNTPPTTSTNLRTGIINPVVTLSTNIQSSSSAPSQGIRPQSATITQPIMTTTPYIRVQLSDQTPDMSNQTRTYIPVQLNQQPTTVNSNNCQAAFTIMPTSNCNSISVPSNSNQSQSEFDIFSSYVAAALKTLPLESAISAQTRIMQILMEEKSKTARNNKK